MVGRTHNRLCVFDHFIVQLVDDIEAGVHKHGAYQLSVSLDGGSHRCGPAPDDRIDATGHVVAPNTPHCLAGEGGRQALFWIAPHSELGRRFGARRVDDAGFGTFEASSIDAATTSDLLRSFDPDVPAAQVGTHSEELLRQLVDAPFATGSDLHPSIRDAIAIVHEELAEPIVADDLARRVGLSTSRFLHLFGEQMGTPLRPHIQWLRLVDSLVRVQSGSSVTDAAAAAGFTDGPHLARTVRQYLGLRASDLRGQPDMTIEVCLTTPAV